MKATNPRQAPHEGPVRLMRGMLPWCGLGHESPRLETGIHGPSHSPADPESADTSGDMVAGRKLRGAIFLLTPGQPGISVALLSVTGERCHEQSFDSANAKSRNASCALRSWWSSPVSIARYRDPGSAVRLGRGFCFCDSGQARAKEMLPKAQPVGNAPTPDCGMNKTLDMARKDDPIPPAIGERENASPDHLRVLVFSFGSPFSVLLGDLFSQFLCLFCFTVSYGDIYT